MGTDIHTVLEIRKNGTWEALGLERDSYGYIMDPPDPAEVLPTDRNYNLFSIMADVRNSNGYDEPRSRWVPISEPRGCPPDASPLVKDWMEEWGHSHSYLTLADLKNYDYSSSTLRTGLVGPDGYMQWKEHGRPNAWCGGLMGADVVFVSHEEMEQYISDPQLFSLMKGVENSLVFTAVQWEVTAREAARKLVEDTIPYMESLVMENGLTDNDVRLVFWFDS